MFGLPILRILPFVTLLLYLNAFMTQGKSDIIEDFGSRSFVSKFLNAISHIRAPPPVEPEEPEDLPRPIICECPDLDPILAKIEQLQQEILLLNLATSINSVGTSKFEFIPNDPSGLNLGYYDVVMESPIQFNSIEVSSYEECREICIMSTQCNTLSVEILDGNIVCKISAESVSNMVLTPSENGLTLAKQTSDAYIGDNGVFYSLDKNERNLEHLIAYCENQFTNGRLVMPMTQLDMDSLLAFQDSEGYAEDNDRFTIYLLEDENGNLVWGDGTPFSDTEVGQTYPITDVGGTGVYEVFVENGENVIRSRDESQRSWAICERDPCG